MEYKLTAVRVFVTGWTRAFRFYLDTLGMTAPIGNVLTLIGGAS